MNLKIAMSFRLRIARGITVATLSLALAVFAHAEPQRGFSGTWIPDLNSHRRVRESKNADPNAPQPPQPAGGLLYLPKIQILDNGKVLDLYYLDDKGTSLSTQHLPTDGSEVKDAGMDADTPRRSRTSRTKNEIRTAWRFVRKGVDVVTGVNIWTLSDDGGTLTQNSTTEDETSRTRTRTIYARSPSASVPVAANADVIDLRGLWNEKGLNKDALMAKGFDPSEWTSPQRLKSVPPMYPASDKNGGIFGRVLIECRLEVSGALSACRTTGAPSASLGAAALVSVRQWQYSPLTVKGQPSAALVEIGMNFAMR